MVEAIYFFVFFVTFFLALDAAFLRRTGFSGGGESLAANTTFSVMNFLVPSVSKRIVVYRELTSSIVPVPKTE
jgi:hypothetical protein